MFGRLLILLYLLLFLPAAWGQQVYIKNQPFTGAVYRDASGIWVELAPLQKALDFTATMEPEGVRVGDRLVRTLTQGDKILIQLQQAVSAVGGVVKENPTFQTVDVHLAVRSKASGGLEIDPLDLAEPENPGESQPPRVVEGQPVSTAAFAFTLPTGMKISRDPRLIKKALLGKDGGAWNQELKVDAMASHEGDGELKRGVAVFTWLSYEVPKEIVGENALIALTTQVALDFMQGSGAEPVSRPRVVESEGQKFILCVGVEYEPPHNLVMVLLRIVPKKKRTYLAVARVPSGENHEANSEKFVSMFSTVTTR